MKNLMFILTMLISVVSYGQFPINYDFDSGSNGWSFNSNGTLVAGLEPYGVITTTTLALGPYPNSTRQIMKSPIVDLSQCSVDLDVSFYIKGIIENQADFMYFQYKIGAGTWINIDTLTGLIDSTLVYSVTSAATRFRFILKANGSINNYISGGVIYLYYYDIDNFNIDCQTSLPVEFLDMDLSCNRISWFTATEINNDYFTIEYSRNGLDGWEFVSNVEGNGNTSVGSVYDYFTDVKTGYYRLRQTDYNGNKTTLPTYYFNCDLDEKIIDSIYNIQGYKVEKYTLGFVIILHKDGTAVKHIFNTVEEWDKYLNY